MRLLREDRGSIIESTRPARDGAERLGAMFADAGHGARRASDLLQNAKAESEHTLASAVRETLEDRPESGPIAARDMGVEQAEVSDELLSEAC